MSADQLPNELLSRILAALELRAFQFASVSQTWQRAVADLQLSMPALFGGNVSGQLGTGTFSNVCGLQRLKPLPGGATIARIGLGFYHTVVLTAPAPPHRPEQQLWTCGRNNAGQCGLGRLSLREHTLQRVELPWRSPVMQIACGAEHTCLLTSDGALFACGSDAFGQLGLGGSVPATTEHGLHHSLRRVPVADDELLARVACGQHHTVVVSTTGVLLACGINLVGQCGHAPDLSLPKTGNPHASLRRLPLAAGAPAQDVACGKANTFALAADGSVWACGWNKFGQCGVGHRRDVFIMEPVQLVGAAAATHVSSGAVHTCIVTADGSLWACGYNGNGQMGDRPRPPGGWVPEGAPPCDLRPQRIAAGIGAVAAVAAGYEHTCIRTKDGALWACGKNNMGQCGIVGGQPNMGSRSEVALQQVPLSGGDQPEGRAVCTYVTCGNGGAGGHTAVLYHLVSPPRMP